MCLSGIPPAPTISPKPNQPNNQPQKPSCQLPSHSPSTRSASLCFLEGNSDKEYHAAIEPSGEGFIVIFAHGRRGSTLTTGAKTTPPVSMAEAAKVFDKLVASRIAGFASSDHARHVFKGVFFPPERGGEPAAANGGILALAPVRFSSQAFILPSAAALVLGGIPTSPRATPPSARKPPTAK